MRRKLFTTAEFLASGRTPKELRWGVRIGRWQRAVHGVYAMGGQPLTTMDVALARVRAGTDVARGVVGAKLLGLDGIVVPPGGLPRCRTRPVVDDAVLVEGFRCACALQVMIDIAALVDDLVWEQANESALHKKLVTIDDELAVLPTLATSRTAGTPRIRRVLALRPLNAPPTESILETLAVQLIRALAAVPEPVRQYRIVYEDMRHHRIDLCWPELGLFIELDGQGHKNQPVYDSLRESAIVAETGWLCLRLTWDEVVRYPRHTARRISRVVMQARRRPLPGPLIFATRGVKQP